MTTQHQTPLSDRAGSIVFYLSGPMSRFPDHNIPAFRAAAEDLRAQGHQIISPAEMGDVGISFGDDGYIEVLSRDISIIVDECQGIIMLPGWEQSQGARLELFCALTYGLMACEYVGTALAPLHKNLALELLSNFT